MNTSALPPSPFGQGLRAARLTAGLTQEQLGKRIGRSKSHIAHLEKGERQPTRATVLALAEVLEVDVATFTVEPAPDHAEVQIQIEVLADLAKRINAAHRAGQTGEAGKLLLEARGKCRYGQWLPWLSTNVHFPRSLAYDYMNRLKLRMPGKKTRLRANNGPEDATLAKISQVEPARNHANQAPSKTGKIYRARVLKFL
jgi:transcriptional regulator with XRE-family HTH domain